MLVTAGAYAHEGHDHGETADPHLAAELGQLDSTLALRLEKITANGDPKDYEKLRTELLDLAAEVENQPVAKTSIGRKIVSVFKGTASLLSRPFRPSSWKNAYFTYAPKFTLSHLAVVMGWEFGIEPAIPVEVGHSQGVVLGSMAAVLAGVHALDFAVWPILYYIPKTFNALRTWARLGGYESAFDFYVTQARNTPFVFDQALGAFQTGDGTWVLIEKRTIAETLLPKIFSIEERARRAVTPTVALDTLERMAASTGVSLKSLKKMRSNKRVYAMTLVEKIRSSRTGNAALEDLAQYKIEKLLLPSDDTDIWDLSNQVSANLARSSLAHLRSRAEHLNFELRTQPNVPRSAFIRASRALYTYSFLVRAAASKDGSLKTSAKIENESERLHSVFDDVEAALHENNVHKHEHSHDCSSTLH